MIDLTNKWKGLRTTSIVTFINNVKYFKGILDGIIVEESTSAQDMGTLIHMYLLEYPKFQETYVTLDYNKPKGEIQTSFCSFIAENLTKVPDIDIDILCAEAYKNCYKAQGKSDSKIKEESKKLYITYKDYIRFLMYGGKKEVISFSTLNYLKDVKRVIEEHKLASTLMIENSIENENHYNEMFVLWEFNKALINNEPIIVKSTIDKLIIDHKNKVIKLVDLKTTNDIAEFNNKFYDYDNYKVQLACYWFAVETYFRTTFPEKNINEYNKETYLVAIQTKNLYRKYPVNCEVFPVSEKTLEDGLNIIEKALPDIAWHFENNLWDHDRYYYEGNGSKKML